MAQLRHILSEDDVAKLQAVKFMSEDTDAVSSMTREELYVHLDIRQSLGATDEEIQAKISEWAVARDVHELLKLSAKARENLRTNDPQPADAVSFAEARRSSAQIAAAGAKARREKNDKQYRRNLGLQAIRYGDPDKP